MTRLFALLPLLALTAATFDGAVRLCAMSDRTVGCPCIKAQAEDPVSLRKAAAHDCCDELTFASSGAFVVDARVELAPPAVTGALEPLPLPALVALPAPLPRAQGPPEPAPLYLQIRTLLI